MKQYFWAALIGGIMLPSAANAATMITFTGTIYSGYDATGTFGSIGDLSGSGFVTQYIVAPKLTTLHVQYPDYEHYEGFAFISAALTINNHTFNFSGINISPLGNQVSVQKLYPYNSQDSVWIDVSDYLYSPQEQEVSNVHNYMFSIVNDFIPLPFVDQEFTYTRKPDDGNSGEGFSINKWINGTTQIDSVYGWFSSQTVTFKSMPAAVPEPETWLMMVCGFGAIGATLRRNRKNMTFRLCRN